MTVQENLSVSQIGHVLAPIGATAEEILDNSGYTLGEAMVAAGRAGMDPEMDYRKVPLIAADAVDEIRSRILAERAELSGNRTPELEPSEAAEFSEDLPIGYNLTEQAFAFDELKRRAEESDRKVVVHVDDIVGRGGIAPPRWSTRTDADTNVWSSRHRSPAVSIPLSHYDAWWANDGENLHMAELVVGLAQRGYSGDISIELERNAGHDGALKYQGVARYELRLDEAEQLAHTILLLLDVARGTTDTVAEGEQ
ncbi:hypothetical protein [Rhodococcus ruber]|uniref:hypothetical protein n=1 Tax=Rhodococcus ruber TaxID=1830 RepID=UPI003783F93C